MEKLWKEVKSGIKTVAKEAEELTRVGRLKLEIFAINQKIEKLMAKLGRRVYNQFSQGQEIVSFSNEMKEMVEKIKSYEEEKRRKETEIKRTEG